MLPAMCPHLQTAVWSFRSVFGVFQASQGSLKSGSCWWLRDPRQAGSAGRCLCPNRPCAGGAGARASPRWNEGVCVEGGRVCGGMCTQQSSNSVGRAVRSARGGGRGISAQAAAPDTSSVRAPERNCAPLAVVTAVARVSVHAGTCDVRAASLRLCVGTRV